jgi:hypothetical protein
MDQARKAAERLWVNRFLGCWDGADSIRSLHCYESPDFYGLLPDRRVGIEVVRLIDEEVASSGPMVREHLARQLEAAANAAGVAVIFDVDFGRENALRLKSPRDRTAVVSMLVELARDPTTHARFLGREELVQRNVVGVDHVRLIPSKPKWGSAVMAGRRGGGTSKEVIAREKALLRARIAKKDAKEPICRSRITKDAALWLLVVTGLSFDSFVDVHPNDGPFETRFDRLFVLDHDPERAFELNVRH